MTSGNDRDTGRPFVGGLEQSTAEQPPGRGALTPEQRDAIFDRRATQLAQPIANLHEAVTVERAASVALVFALGGEHYAFASAHVREVRPVGEITRLPGTPAFVAGLVNVRGRIVPVLDLRLFFGLSTTLIGTGSETVVILGSVRGDVGVLATGRPTVRAIGDRLRALPPTAPSGLQAAYVRGVTPDLVVVLDAELLFADERIIVQAVV